MENRESGDQGIGLAGTGFVLQFDEINMLYKIYQFLLENWSIYDEHIIYTPASISQ